MAKKIGSPAPPSLADIERALDEVVSTLVAYRRSPPEAAMRAVAQKPKGFHVLNLADLDVDDLDVLGAQDLVSAPVEEGLKHSIRKIGKLIHAIVGDEGMQAVAHRVAGLDESNLGRRLSPIDSAWNGIGTWIS